MDDIKITIRFWFFRIIFPAVRKSFSFAEAGSKIVGAAIEFVVSIILILGLGQSGNIPNFGLNLTTVVLVLLFMVALRIIREIIYLPAKIYSEQGGFIENPFEISAFDPTANFSQTDQKWVSIRVNNRSSVANIENCFLELYGIVDLGANETIAFEPQKLTWSGREQNRIQDGNQPITVYFDSPRWCDIATVVPQQNIAEYTTWFGSGLEQTRIKPGTYRLTVKANGEWKSHPISSQYLIEMSFQPENHLMIGKIEEEKEAKWNRQQAVLYHAQ